MASTWKRTSRTPAPGHLSRATSGPCWTVTATTRRSSFTCPASRRRSGRSWTGPRRLYASGAAEHGVRPGAGQGVPRRVPELRHARDARPVLVPGRGDSRLRRLPLRGRQVRAAVLGRGRRDGDRRLGRSSPSSRTRSTRRWSARRSPSRPARPRSRSACAPPPSEGTSRRRGDRRADSGTSYWTRRHMGRPCRWRGPRRAEELMMTTTTATDLVLAELRGAVLVLTLNRPERLNTWTDALEDATTSGSTRPRTTPRSARSSSRAPARVLRRRRHGRPRARGHRRRRRGRIAARPPAATDLPLTVRKPLVAAINGAAAGLGLVGGAVLRHPLRDAAGEAHDGVRAPRPRGRVRPRLAAAPADRDQPRAGPPAVRPHRARRGGAPARAGRPPQRAEALVDDAVAYATDLADNCSPWSMATIKAQIQADLDRSFAAAVTGRRRARCSRRSTSRTSRRACAATSSAARRRSPAFEPRKEGS